MDNVNKKSWLVKLEMTIGEYEKISRHLVEAETEEEATNEAYAMEQHCDSAEWNEDLEVFEDDHGGMAYRAYSCVEVPWDDAVVLRKYL